MLQTQCWNLYVFYHTLAPLGSKVFCYCFSTESMHVVHVPNSCITIMQLSAEALCTFLNRTLFSSNMANIYTLVHTHVYMHNAYMYIVNSYIIIMQLSAEVLCTFLNRTLFSINKQNIIFQKYGQLLYISTHTCTNITQKHIRTCGYTYTYRCNSIII